MTILNIAKMGGDEGGIKELTSADYNYHWGGSVDDGIAVWKLDAGFYRKGAGIKIYLNTTSGSSSVNSGAGTFIVLDFGTNYKGVLIWDQNYRFYIETVDENGQVYITFSELLTKSYLVDNVTTDRSDLPLSAKQGKVLADRIGSLSSLQTTDKTSVVNAINELVGSGTNTINSQDWSDLWQ